MSKPPKVVIPGLNRGIGVPPGFVLGRLPGTGHGPAQLLNLTSLRRVGLATAANVTQSTVSAISIAHSETVSLSSSISTVVSSSISTVNSKITSLSTAIGAGADDDTALSTSLSSAVSINTTQSTSLSQISSSLSTEISVDLSRINSLSTAIGGGGGVDDDSGLSTSLSQVSSSLSGAISSTTSLSTAISTVVSGSISTVNSRIDSLSTAGGGGADDDTALSSSLSQVSSSLSGAISSTSSLSTAVSTVDSNQSTSISINLSKINSLSTAVGGGSSGGTPTIRATTITSSSASSYTLNWPTGTIAGDVVILFGGHGFAIIQPTGWQQIDNSTGSNVNGAVFAKLMNASDISTGHVVVTTGGGFDGCFALATITGSTMTGLRLPVSAVRSSAGTTSAYFGAGATDLFSTDTILMFSMTRGNIACTFTGGVTSLQAVNAGSASGALGHFTGTLAALGPDESASFASSGTGYYTAVLAVR